MSEETPNSVDILLVEDNPGDVILALEAFKETSIKCFLHTVHNGEAALDYLNRRGEYIETARMPHLILLDLNLPKLDGRQFLEIIKNDDELKHIPVIVLTSSKAEADLKESYALHANSYIVKPPDPEAFVEVVHALENYWFKTALLPPRKKHPDPE